MRRKQDRYSPVQKSEALEVVVVERQVMMFLQEVNKEAEEGHERFISEITLFEFRKYIQDKRENLDP
jgi:hypothetical protein